MTTNRRNGDFARLVIERDGKCQVCGSTKNLQAHHIIPLSEGGLDMPENGETLCPDCHADKHPDVPRMLFLERAYGKAMPAPWNATSLAAEIGCCVRTVTRIAKRLGIERDGGTWGFNMKDKEAIEEYHHPWCRVEVELDDHAVLTVREVARIYGVAQPTVTSWCRDGLLPARKFGRSWAIPASALADFEPPERGRPRKS